MSELPKRWALTHAIEVAGPIRGVSYKKEQVKFTPDEGYTAVLRANNIQDNQLVFDDLVYVPDSNITTEQRLRKNDIVIAMSSGSLSVVGKSAQVQLDVRASFGAFCGALRPSSEIEPRYLGLFLKSDVYRKSISNLAKGSNINNLKWSHFEEIPLPLAPLPEQKRIADKLDATLARVDACRERLARVAPILKRFRQSVLAAATSGELTADWREQQGYGHTGNCNKELQGNTHAGRVGEALPDTSSANPSDKASDSSALQVTNLPSKWKRVALGDVILDLRYGTSKKCDYSDSGKIVLRIPNMADKWKLDLADVKRAEFTLAEIKKLELVKGDLLLIRSNGSVDLVGKTCMVTEHEEGLLFAGYLMRMRVASEIVMPEYVCLSMSGPDLRVVIESTSKSTSGVNNINSDEVRGLPINLPSKHEQTEIVRRVETLFAFADRLEVRLASASAAAERLTPSLLAKAFRGELVPQDPNDEPASELLKRLAAQREAMPKAKRGKKSATDAGAA